MNRPSDPALIAPATVDSEAFFDNLQRGIHAGHNETRMLVDNVLDGTVDLEAFGRWLVALADAGESAEEIAGVAASLRGKMLSVSSQHAVIADTCGTGGDGSGSFNISTAAAIVVAAAGLPIAKHGNRAVSSRTGSADVLEQLGVRIDAPPATAARCLNQLGLCFCLAPIYHPAMARVGPLRRSLGRSTVFNLVGPLCNPAGATVQVIGVGRESAREPMARAAMLMGASRVLVVSGRCEGGGSQSIDEISLFGATDVIDVSATAMRGLRWTPEDFGIATQPASRMVELTVAGPPESAAAIREVLAGSRGLRRDIVVLNAAAILWAAGRSGDLPGARLLAEAAIDSGEAAGKLECLAHLTHEDGRLSSIL
ncbi:MAG: anthranilate phosphoribosyltransferase [Planctomycetota bacterium]